MTTTETDVESTPLCVKDNCKELRVSGSHYCDDHVLEQQVAASRQPRSTGGSSLASLIRGAKKQGLIKPVSQYAGS